MTETHTDNGVHEDHEHDGGSFDAAAPADEMKEAARFARAKVARHTARVDQLMADRNRIDDAIAVERAGITKANAILTWAAKDEKPRGKRKAAQTASKGKR